MPFMTPVFQTKYHPSTFMHGILMLLCPVATVLFLINYLSDPAIMPLADFLPSFIAGLFFSFASCMVIITKFKKIILTDTQIQITHLFFIKRKPILYTDIKGYTVESKDNTLITKKGSKIFIRSTAYKNFDVLFIELNKHGIYKIKNGNEFMRAIKLKQPGDVKQLEYIVIPQPQAASGEVVIKTKAISINPVDVKTRSGKGIYGRLKEIDPLIIGWDISGIVDEVGADVSDFKIGDEVFGMINFPGHGKAYAQYVAAPVSHITHKPSNISHNEAAAATLAALTAWQVLVTHANVQPGQKVLIHAAAGGVGHYAVQIAKHLGAYVIGTSSAAKKAFILNLGADEHIDYTTQKFEQIVTDADLVFDTVGGEIFARSLDAVKKNGLVISIPTGMSGDIEAAAKEKGVIAKAMLVQSDGTDMKSLADLLQSGKIKSHVASVYSFDDMAKAHTELEKGRTTGKIIVTVP